MCRHLGCQRGSTHSGWCSSHYMQIRRKGYTSDLRIVGDPEKRFWSKVIKTDTCWLWGPGPKDSHGYGQFSIGRKKVYPHRFSFELLVAPIAPGLEIDHICRNKICVNPDHLRATTREINLTNREDYQIKSDGIRRCYQGHEIVGDNDYERPNNRHECRKCIRARKARTKP